jgi:hypothetical protein
VCVHFRHFVLEKGSREEKGDFVRQIRQWKLIEKIERIKILSFIFSSHTDMHHHVKSERDKDDDDDLDDDRKSGIEMGHHGHHGYYGQHPMMGYHSHHGMKTEMDANSKNQTGSDCGVPIPASKPKIWSLADTAACKTPPPHSHLHPLGGSWAYHQQQQQQTHPTAIQYNNNNNIDAPLHHQQQQQQSIHHQNLQSQQHQQHLQSQQQPIHQQQSHMMNMAQGNGTSAQAGMTMNVHQQQQPPQMNGMNGMMSTFGGNSPYSRYGGFLAATHPTQMQQAPVAGQQHHPYINNNNQGSTTPVTPNSTGQPTTPTLQQQQQNINSQTSNSNQTMGFPEIQTGEFFMLKFFFNRFNSLQINLFRHTSPNSSEYEVQHNSQHFYSR